MVKVNIDKAGRIVLPKLIRDALHLAPGDALELIADDDRVVLRPRRQVPPLQKERGVWVFRTGEPLSTETVHRALVDLRSRRDRGAAGDPA